MGAPVHANQPSFSAGELAPAVQGRVDMAKYASGLKTARNGIVHLTGGFSNRPGTLFVAATKFSNKKSRLIPFEVSITQAYMLEFGDKYIRFYKNGAQIQMVGATGWVTGHSYNIGDFVTQGGLQYYCIVQHISGTFATDLAANKWVRQDIYEVPTPYLEADLPLLKVVQSANTLYIAHQSYFPQTLVRNSDISWVLSNFPFHDGPFMLENTVQADLLTATIAVGVGTLDASGVGFSPFQAGHAGSIWRITDHVVNQTTTSALTNGIATSAIRGYKQWRLSTTGTWAGIVTIQIQGNAAGTGGWINLVTFASNSDVNFNTFGAIPYGFPIFMRVLATLSGGTVNATLSCDDFNFDYVLNATARNSGTQMVVTYFPPDAGSLTISFVTNTTPDWNEGSWSNVRGYPSVVGFYQDRLIWATTPSEPQTEWLSQTGDYPNYGVSDPLVDSDAISVNLNSRKVNTVQNLLSMIRLVMLTSSSEFSLGPGSSGVLAPTSIDLKVQGYRGSSGVPAVVIGNKAVYVQPMGTIIRSIGYEFYTDTFSGDNLSILSSHLFTNFTILDLAYQQEPDSIVWAARSDGILLSMTFMPEQQVTAWTWHDTQGKFEAVACIPNAAGGYDELWVIVNRPNGRFVERLAQRLPTFNLKDQIHLDNAITFDGTNLTATTMTLSGRVTITAGVNDTIVLESPPNTLVGAAVIAPGNYSMAELAVAFQTALNAVSALVFTVTVHGTGTTLDPFRLQVAVVTALTSFAIASPVSYPAYLARSAHVSLGFNQNTSYDGDNGSPALASNTPPGISVFLTGPTANLQVLTLTASAAFFNIGMVGSGIMLEDASGNELLCTITAYVSTTVVKVTPAGPVPAEFQLTAISLWAFASLAISGLDQLNGQAVMALADGQVRGPFTVSGGAITLPTPGALVHVGLSYITDFETLNFESQVQDGSSQGRRQRVPQVNYKFKDTAGGNIGPNASRLNPVVRTTSDVGVLALGLYTGDYRRPIPGDWSSNGRTFFRQTDPLPVTILGVTPNVERGDL